MRREILAIMLATVAFSLWGYFWYATVFDDIWQSLIGKTEDELITLASSRGQIQDFYTLAISFIHVMGIWGVLKLVRAKSCVQYILLSVLLSTAIVLPALGNATVFAGTPLNLLVLDYGHFLLGYAGIALVLFLVGLPHKLTRKPQKP